MHANGADLEDNVDRPADTMGAQFVHQKVLMKKKLYQKVIKMHIIVVMNMAQKAVLNPKPPIAQRPVILLVHRVTLAVINSDGLVTMKTDA